MFNLSTQEVVLSIEKSPLKIVRGILYQEYSNFFGNTINLNFGKKENFEKLENQTQLNRLKLRDDDIDLKKLKIFFMNSNITQALEKKFKSKFKFDSVDVWIDGKGYKLSPHVDDPRIKLHLQIPLQVLVILVNNLHGNLMIVLLTLHGFKHLVVQQENL